MASTQRHNTEQAHGDGHRKHRSKRAETADTVAPSSSAPVTSHNKSSSKQRSSTLPSTSYQGAYPSMHTMAGGVPVAATSTSAPTPYYAGDTSRAHMKTRADKPSPRSSNERITLPDDRSARRARTAHPAMAAVQAPSSTQYYVDPPQVAGETSSRHRRERDKERDKERERERRREEKARARLQEAESLRTQEKKERDRERRKEREPEPERASRDRDGHRSTERTKERESSRRKEERRAAEKAAAPAASSSTAAHRTPQTDDRPTTSSVRSPIAFLLMYLWLTDADVRLDMLRRVDSLPTQRRNRPRSLVAMLYLGRLQTTTTQMYHLQLPTDGHPIQHLWQCHSAPRSVTRIRRASTGLTVIGWQVKAVVKSLVCRAVNRSSL